MQKGIIGIIVASLVVAFGYWYITQEDKPEENTNIQTSTQAPISATTTSIKIFTMVEVASHNSRASCYSAIRGNVYDLTSWIGNHPGGSSKILGLCGSDGTSIFEKQHGGSEQQEDTLAGFKVGTLSK